MPYIMVLIYWFRIIFRDGKMDENILKYNWFISNLVFLLLFLNFYIEINFDWHISWYISEQINSRYFMTFVVMKQLKCVYCFVNLIKLKVKLNIFASNVKHCILELEIKNVFIFENYPIFSYIYAYKYFKFNLLSRYINMGIL